MSDLWDMLRENTAARIGLGRAGDSLPTARVLEFAAAHAAARDAVHHPLDVEGLVAAIAPIGLGTPEVVASRAVDRSEYLRRPDFGRTPGDDFSVATADADIGIVLADGLSPIALTEHAVGVVTAIKDVLAPTYSIATPVIATQARVALGDHIGAAQKVGTLIVVIGERPGLSVADSVGIYLTHLPRPGRADSERNCISNIHPPGGQSYVGAARVVAALVEGARALGRSGVDLKDTSRTLTT
ncbi:ethanolamine ammonia-lyase subunit EutC [Williamsia herbipolensis]|uniref:Ethanolamine ammonia-lyase small subunit n=1 Tax=Williamsia herbipolensis TaxID=1603258 RepID=A0AAU4JZL4_9NOCA|nr:ethanolamine ammonia-lyase subunit EutC [Williamsia herbipolensis]MCX6468414.1 ethanolamine ammonia-lyase subunit EutC [Mycobacteriales bacterium]